MIIRSPKHRTLSNRIRPAWHWRLRHWLGFDSTRRGILYIPDELNFPRFPGEDDKFLNYLIKLLTEPIRPPSRWYRFQRWAGFDQARHRKTTDDARTMIPIILRGPANAEFGW